jgi:hypothetical protein
MFKHVIWFKRLSLDASAAGITRRTGQDGTKWLCTALEPPQGSRIRVRPVHARDARIREDLVRWLNATVPHHCITKKSLRFALKTAVLKELTCLCFFFIKDGQIIMIQGI